MTYSCLLVDDEPPALRILEHYVRRIPQLQLAGACSDALEAAAFLQANPVDLLFLDINLPEISGIQFLRSLPLPPKVVFTTAYPEYALEGFELSAVDYLVKPIPFDRFLRAVHKAVESLDARKRPAEAPRPLLVRADRKLFRVDPADILFLQAYGDYVKIVTRHGNITPKCTLQELEEQLPGTSFLRVHRSYLVARVAIRYLEGNQLRVGEEYIPVGQSYREQLIEQLGR